MADLACGSGGSGGSGDANDYSRFEQLADPDDESPVDAARREKDAGNESFQAADFDGAIARYQRNTSQPLRCRFDSCAVVGSSGGLRGAQP